METWVRIDAGVFAQGSVTMAVSLSDDAGLFCSSDERADAQRSSRRGHGGFKIVATDSKDRLSNRDWRKAQDAIDTLVRMQIARGLAPLFLKRNRPYEDNAQLSAMIRDRLLHKAAFIQKPPFILQFYKRLLFAMDEEPRSILEIGVKGGGSTALWKALFPSATVVGMDIEIRRWLSAPSEDGVIYVEGDQSDSTKLAEIARDYGPFSVVIDDGSHRIDHQFTTMRCLLPHVRPGGFYVVEDIHTSAKQLAVDETDESGGDSWGDFVMMLFQQRRKGPLPSETAGTRLALDVAPMTDDLIVARRVLAIRAKERDTSSASAIAEP
jgi:predicted O-methyltransferase YrrM